MINKKGATQVGIVPILIIVGAILAVGWFVTQEDAQLAITPTGEKAIVPGLCETDTVTVSFADLKSANRTGTTATNDVNKVTINGTGTLAGFDVLTDQTMTYGDNFVAYYMHSGTEGSLTAGTDYYGTVVSGTIDDCGKDYVSARPYLASSLTTWLNNDPSNATTRNATGAQDAYSAGTSLIPTLYLQVSTQYGAFGINPNASVDGVANKGIFLFADYNGIEIDTIEPAASLVKTSNLGCPPTHAVPSGDAAVASQTACTGWELNTYQLSGIGTTLAIPIAVTADASYDPVNDMNFFIEDADMYIHTDGSFKIDWWTDTGSGVGVAVVDEEYYIS